ncbi:unnamed protein product, partial [Rotaria sp. Silwood2]
TWEIKELKIKANAATKQKQFKKATKQKQFEEATKQKQFEEEEATKRKQIEEVEATKRLKIVCEQWSSLTNINSEEFSCSHDFYNFCVKKNIREFDVNYLLIDNEHFNNNVQLCIENYLNNVLQLLKKPERQCQELFNRFIMELLLIFNDCTQLKLMNVSKYNLKEKYYDFKFMFKNIKININEDDKCLDDFIVYVGELKTFNIRIKDKSANGQTLQYLQRLLDIQGRKKIYGFLTNITHIRFFYVEKDPIFGVYNYFKSRTLKMLDYSFKEIRKTNMKTTTINKQLRQIYLNKDTWIIFTKFVIMNIDFYQYTTLIENDINKLFNNKYDIIRKLDYGQQCVIKICKQTKYLSLYLNEIKIMKELNISNRFNLFFENIIDSSPTGNISF